MATLFPSDMSCGRPFNTWSWAGATFKTRNGIEVHFGVGYAALCQPRSAFNIWSLNTRKLTEQCWAIIDLDASWRICIFCTIVCINLLDFFRGLNFTQYVFYLVACLLP